VGSLDGRISKLEKLSSDRATSAWDPEREAIIAELEHLEERNGPLRERAEREAEEGFPQRLHALLELEEHVQKRRDSR
jgi:anti-sigma factor RsiW